MYDLKGDGSARQHSYEDLHFPKFEKQVTYIPMFDCYHILPKGHP